MKERRKLSVEEKKKIQKLAEEGKSITEISKLTGIDYTVVYYHLDPKKKRKLRLSASNSFQRLKQKEESRKRRREYIREYMRKRYHEDEKFRKRIKALIRKYQKRKTKSYTRALTKIGEMIAGWE